MKFLPILPWYEWLLRVAVAGSFIYPPIAALFYPYSWIGFFPAFVTALVTPHEMLLLHVFGVFEILLALTLLTLRDVRVPALIASGMLVAIVAFNVPQIDVVFRDLSIALAAAALVRRPHTA